MKTKSILLALTILIAFALPIVAQEETKMDVTVQVDDDDDGAKKVFIKKMGPGLDLTEEQQAQVKDLRLQQEKEILPLENDLRVKRLDLKIAMKDKDNVNMGKVNSIVDDIHKIKAELEKKKIAHDLKFRALLTDEQKKKHDAMDMGMRNRDIRIFKHRSGECPGGEDLMWFGEDGEDFEFLKDIDVDVQIDDAMPPQVRKKVIRKRL